LLQKEVEVIIEEVDGFFSKISSDGKVYLPNSTGLKLNLIKDEIILLEAIIEDKLFSNYTQVKTREKKNTKEYHCQFNINLKNKEGLFKIKELTSRTPISINTEIKKLLDGLNYAQINVTDLIVFYGNRVPIIINKNINIKDFAYYLGCYFSDGTKKGNSWGIVASTFQQANLFIKTHKNLIKNNNIIYELSFSRYSHQEENKTKLKLKDIWEAKTSITLNLNKIRTRKIKASLYSKRNQFGSLVIKENKHLSLLFYNRMLNILFSYIFIEKNKELADDFLLGCFEGDGGVSSKTHAHIILTTNAKEFEILTQVAQIGSLKFKAHHEPAKIYYLRFHSLSILSNLDLLKFKLFQYYPKRRKVFIERFLEIGAVKFILGIQPSTSGWIKNYLQKENILYKRYKLTKKGKEIKKALIGFKKELISLQESQTKEM
jgi:hypothetical protein